MRFTVNQFNERFPNDETRLDYMFEQAYGNMPACLKCGVVDPSYYRVRSRKCFECCIKTSKGDGYFFLDIFEDNQPFFVLIRRIRKYLEYAGSGEWSRYDEDGGLPTILFVVQNKSVHKRLRKRPAKELRDSYEEVSFATTKLEYLLDSEYKGKVWFSIDEEG